MINDLVSSVVDSHISGLEDEFESDLAKLIEYMEEIYVPSDSIKVEDLANITNDEIKEKLIEIGKNIYAEKEEEFTPEQMREIERVILLRVVDTKWMDHIDDMDHLKERYRT